VFLGGHTVAMVTYFVTKMITTFSTMIGQRFDIMIVASSEEDKHCVEQLKTCPFSARHFLLFNNLQVHVS